MAACGGGGDDVDRVVAADAAQDTAARQQAQALGDVRRTTAARAAATSKTNACSLIHPFYWELGGAQARKASGSVDVGFTGTTKVAMASASKWLYSAYVMQTRALSPESVPYLNFTSGNIDFETCLPRQTVQQCADARSNGGLSPDAVGRFNYDGGHMQRHAVMIGLGSWDSAKLAADYNRVLGTHVSFFSPWIEAGAETTADDYAAFLRRIMTKGLKIEAALGSNQVCTDPATCPTAMYSPTAKPMNYSLGHWVEVDFDGAYSSAGGAGFYPWISADKSLYGIVSRQGTAGTGDASADCGRAIRNAWVSMSAA